MKALIKHLMRENYEEILSRSIVNCHCMGLHSIMLLEQPGKTIRIFVAATNHDMWRNIGGLDSDHSLSIGFHPHHCNLTIQCIYGRIQNIEVKEVSGKSNISKFVFDSKILNGKGGFTYIQPCRLSSDRTTNLKAGESIYMPAKSIHTVGVGCNEKAAWFVLEGRGNTDHVPYTYSNSQLDIVPLNEKLYQPMTEELLFHLLETVTNHL